MQEHTVGKCLHARNCPKSMCTVSEFRHTIIKKNNNNNRIHRCNSRFFTISLQRREPSPTRTLQWPGRNHVQITCNTSSACHVQYVVLCATWYEGTAQLLSLTEFKSESFELFIFLAELLINEGGVARENPWRRASENATH